MSAKNLIFLLIIVNDCIRMMQAATKPPVTANYLGSHAMPAGSPALPSFPLSATQIASLGPIHPDVFQDTLLPAVRGAFLSFLFIFTKRIHQMIYLFCSHFYHTNGAMVLRYIVFLHQTVTYWKCIVFYRHHVCDRHEMQNANRSFFLCTVLLIRQQHG